MKHKTIKIPVSEVKARKNWGTVVPVTRVERNEKAYRRNPKHKGKGWE